MDQIYVLHGRIISTNERIKDMIILKNIIKMSYKEYKGVKLHMSREKMNMKIIRA